MRLFKSKEGSIISEYFTPIELEGVNDGLNVEVSLYDDHIEITTFKKDKTFTLPYERITDVYHGYISELKDNGHVIGRALAGGFLFGGAGAVVGAISGNFKKKVKKLVLIISYKGQDGSDKFLKFEDKRQLKGGKVAKIMAEKIKTDKDNEIVML